MAQLPEGKLLIDGVLRGAKSGATYPDISPWTGKEFAQIPDAGADETEEAIAAARRAFDTTDWSTDHAGRLKILRRYAEVLRANRDRFAEIALHEVGAAQGTIAGPQVDQQLAMLDGTLALLENYQWVDDRGIGTNSFGAARRLVKREAGGVVGAITPWNVPLQINLAKVIPALAAGCTVILKPAPETPLMALFLGELAVEAGLPKGVLNVIVGKDPALIGEKLVTDPRVDLISFTGSTAIGRHIMKQGAETMTRVFLELGGKSASIILEDADFPNAVLSGLGITFHAGQACAIMSRLLVPKSRYEEAVQILTPMFKQVPWGDPKDPSHMMGPVISAKQRDRILNYIEIGKAEGATLAAGGGTGSKGDGFFIEPTLFTNVSNDMRIAREEIFGPVLCLIPFEDDEDAIRIANDSEYGLASMVNSGSLDRARAIADRIRAGLVVVNNGAPFGADIPFGGYKQSGIGREMGIEGFEEYLEVKAIGVPV